MANIKSQKKRIITAEKARKRNQAVKSELKTAVRAVREAVAAGNGVEAYTKAQHACRLLDKAASKGIIHKNQASNRKKAAAKAAKKEAYKAADAEKAKRREATLKAEKKAHDAKAKAEAEAAAAEAAEATEE